MIGSQICLKILSVDRVAPDLYIYRLVALVVWPFVEQHQGQGSGNKCEKLRNSLKLI